MPKALICVALCGLAAAQVPSPKPSETNVPAVPPQRGEGVRSLTVEDLHAFLDGIMPIQLDRSDEAGAVVEIVRGDDVLLEKGYGFSDVEKKTAVDPAVSGFRPGSISKLFTWISVMQLREQGKVDLDADVNRYLDFTVPHLTLRNLMTHRAGFEEEVRDLIRAAPADFIPLRQYLVENQPAQVYPPGEIPAYSNYGAGLAGYIVQRVSGERFEDYVRRHIFEPLGMARSSFEQPTPKNWAVHPTAGYGRAENKMLPFEIVEPAPAGGLTTTGADMVRFARALIHGGELEGHRILKPETLREMWTPQFRANPQMAAMCLGFYQQLRNGTRWVGHGGDLIAYHSLFMIQPESQTAMFLSYNSAGIGRGTSIERPELFNQFVDRYYGPARDLPTVAKGTPASDVIGIWWSSRRGVKNRLKLLTLFDQSKISEDKDGNPVDADTKSVSGETIHWKPAGRDLWVYPEGQRHLAAIRDARGRVVRLATDFPAAQMQRVPWYAESHQNLTLLSISLFALGCVVWAALLRLVQRNRFMQPLDPPLRRMRRVQVIMSVAWLVIFGVLVAVTNATGGSDTFPPSHDFDKWLLLIDIAVGIAIGLSLATSVVTVRLWRRLPGPWLRVRLAVVALAGLWLVWFSIYWKVIGPASHF